MNFNYIIFFYQLLNIGVFGISTRIVGGINADIIDFPHSASLRFISSNEHICSGSIISHWHILTAAHCVDESIIDISTLKIHIGFTKLLSTNGTVLYVEHVYLHPSFKEPLNEESKILGDIAIIKVHNKIEFNEFQRKIKLPNTDVFNNYIASLSGWGITNFIEGTNPENLQKTWMRILPNDQCKELTSTKRYLDQFCAFQRIGVGPCIGDSGSALAYHDIIVGITSITIPCATGEPDLYTNVYYHINFIKEIIES